MLQAVIVVVCSVACVGAEQPNPVEVERPSSLEAGNTAQRPNVVFIFSDQQHYQAMGFVDDFYATPNLDLLAAESVVFEHSFVTTPQCSPSRSSMMTGLYPHKTGVLNNVGAAGGAELTLPTIGKRLQDAGYLTGFMGKWHLGNDELANSGWDVGRGTDDGTIKHPALSFDENTTAAALSFIDDHAAGDKPLFMFLMYLDPHDIYYFQNRPNRDPARYQEAVLGESWYEEDLAAKPGPQLAFMAENQGQIIHGAEKEEWQYYRDYYRQKVELLDAQVGRVLAGLKANGMWENTIIVYSSDHGDMDTFHKLIFKGPFMYEHMIRVPALVRVPAGLGGVAPYVEREHDWVNVDILPTVLDLAGLEVPEVDGISYEPLLTGGEQGAPREFVVTQYYGKQQWVNPIRSIRTHEFKYNLYTQFGEELYDLENDPEEIVNLAGDPEYAQVKADLRSTLDTWIAENGDDFYSYTVTEMRSTGPIMGRDARPLR